MHIMLIRHAKHGKPAQPEEGNLTRLGINQAQRTGDSLVNQGIERLLSSPYPRSMQTASIISKRIEVPVNIRVCLHNKIRPGEITTTRASLEKMYPDAIFQPDMPEVWSPGGETGQEVYERLVPEAEWIRSLEPVNERIAIVSHAFTLDALISMLTDLPPKKSMRFWFDNCCLSLVSIVKGVGRLHYLNLVGHLGRRDLFF